MQANYYKVEAIDINGYTSESIHYLGQKIDSIPPSLPAIFTGDVDNKGIVTLTWTPSISDDILGYRVFMSNSLEAEYAEVTTVPVIDTLFEYALNLQILSKYVYFRITAVDHHYNETDWSNTVTIVRPDIIPPAAPNLVKVVPSHDSITVTWRFSPSEDVFQHIVQRKSAGTYHWETIFTQYGPQSAEVPVNYFDTTYSYHYFYDYRIVASDESGNKSYSNVVKVRPIVPAVRGSFSNIVIETINTSQQYSPTFYYQNIDQLHFKNILIHWDYQDLADVLEFEIFRSIGSNNPLRSYATIDMDWMLDNEGNTGGQLPAHKMFFVDMDLAKKASTFNSSGTGGGGTGSPGSGGTGGSGGGGNSGGGSTSFPGIFAGTGNTIDSDVYTYQIICHHNDGSTSPLSPLITIQL